MKIKDIILEMAQADLERLGSMKTVIASKIKQLPDDEVTAKALREIEELLQYVGAGGRKGMIDNKLKEINDPAVDAFRTDLGRYLLNILDNANPKDKDELFTLWKDDKIVNIDKLLSRKSHSFAEIFNGYERNPVITELVDDLMQEQRLGHGKGELALNVLSKKIYKPGQFKVNKDNKQDQKNKGDLIIGGRKIELKTTDIGAARFTDQEVRAAPGYEQSAGDLKSFILTNRNSFMPELKVPASGINSTEAMNFYQAITDPKLQAEYAALVENSVRLIFGGENAPPKTVQSIMDAFISGNIGKFKQEFSVASLNYYLSLKDDEGVLNFDLPRKEAIFYRNADDLTAEKMRLEAKTIYLANADPRNVYPQLKVIPATFGADAAKAEKQKTVRTAVSTLPAAQDPVELEQTLQTVILDLAEIKGIEDPTVIQNMFTAATEWLSKQKNKTTIEPNSLETFLKNQGFFDTKKPDELDQLVKNAGIAKSAAPVAPVAPAAPGAATV